MRSVNKVRLVAVVLTTLLVAATVVVVVLSLQADGPRPEAKTSAETTERQTSGTSPDATNSGTDSPDQAQGPTTALQEQTSTASEETPDIPNLDDPDDLRALNAFLSVFTESNCGLEMDGKGHRTFDRDTSSGQLHADLAFVSFAQDGGEIEDVDPSQFDQWFANVRVSTDKLDEVLYRLCGRTYDWPGLEEPQYVGYHYLDGYLYAEITNWVGMYGPAVATAVRAEDDGTITVDYAGYYQTALRYTQLQDDGTQYGLNEDQLVARYGLNPNGRGTARLECSRTDEGWDFRLIRLEATVDE